MLLEKDERPFLSVLKEVVQKQKWFLSEDKEALSHSPLAMKEIFCNLLPIREEFDELEMKWQCIGNFIIIAGIKEI